MKTPKACNDNSAARSRYMGTDYNGPMMRFLKYIPIAQRLIRRYCQYPWKHSPEHMEYSFLEYQLCTYLEQGEPNPSHRRLKVDGIAWCLGQQPLVLYNDPNLPF